MNLTGTLDNTGTMLALTAATGSWNVVGGTLKGGTYTAAGGAELIFTSSGGTLDGVTANANLDLSGFGNANATVIDGLTLNATALLGNSGNSNYGRLFFNSNETLAGNGSVQFGNDGNNALYVSNSTLTIGSGITVHGVNGGIHTNNGTATLINQGTIAADSAGGTITVDTNSATYQGTLQASNGGTLALGGTWNAAGSTFAVTGGTLNLGGSFTTAGLGTFQRTGGTVNLTGTLDNTGTTLALTATTGSWNLVGGTLKGGTYTGAGGAELVFTASGGTLDGVTANANLDLTGFGNANATVIDGLTLNATALLGDSGNSNYGRLFFSNNETLGGTGSVQFGNDTNNALYVSGITLTIGPAITVHGVNGGIHTNSGTAALISQGTIAADGAGGSITVDTNSVTNQGTLQAANGETLTVSSLAPNTGLIVVGVGSKLTVNGAFIQSSTGSVNLSVGGVASGQYGVFAATGSATLAGTLNVALVGGYSPRAGDSIPIITFGSKTGTFSTVNVATLPQGIAATAVSNATNVTLTFGNALMANVAGPGAGAGSELTQQELTPVVAEALERWTAAGLDATGLALLRRIEYQIVNLPGAELGMQAGNTIWLDQDAAGHGWFLDTSPANDHAFFQPTGADVLQAPAGSPASGAMDLLTAVEHEMGHELGLQDEAAAGLMDETLEVGTRILPSPALAAQANGNVAGSVVTPRPTVAGTFPGAAAVDDLFQVEDDRVSVIAPLAWIRGSRLGLVAANDGTTGLDPDLVDVLLHLEQVSNRHLGAAGVQPRRHPLI